MRHLNSLRGQAINSDATPLAVDWSTIGYNNKDGVYAYSSRQIKGINRPITLQIEFNAGDGDLFYKINAGTDDGSDYTQPFDPVGLGFTQLNNGDRIIINVLDYLDFGAEPYSVVTDWVTVYNVTDGFKILDTINLT